jgi:glutaredoxin
MEQHDVEFDEADIISDLEARREMLTMTGQSGVPVIRVGEKAMVGWDQDEFERLLALGPRP